MILKKSLTHAGVLISLIILVILLLVNWDKCFVLPLKRWFEPGHASTSSAITKQQLVTNGKNVTEGFEDPADAEAMRGIDSRDIKLDLNPATQKITVSFTGFKPVNKSVYDAKFAVKSYLLVLAKYDKDLNKIGTLDVKISEEEGGRTFIDDLRAFVSKNSGILNKSRQDSILRNQVGNNMDLTYVMNLFIGDSSKNYLSSLNDQPTQEVPLFFELLNIIYKHNKAGIREIYEDLTYLYTDLPQYEGTANPTGDRNYDYLQVSTDRKEGAADLKKAMAYFDPLKSKLNIKTSTVVPTTTNVNTPNSLVLDGLRTFLEEQIRLAESDTQVGTENVCDSATNMCKYTFTQVLPSDPQGNIYYYKLGIGVIHVDKNTGDDKISKIKPYTFGNGGKLQYFRVDTSLSDQEKLLRRLEELERVSAQKALQQPVSGTSAKTSGSAQMDVYMNMLKPYLGNYPDQYLMSDQQGKELSLDNYIGQSLAMGQINVNADFTALSDSK